MRSSPNPDEVVTPTRPGMPKQRYPIDGTWMTVDQIAAMLGVTVRALYNQRQYCFSFPTATGAIFRYIRTPRFHGRDWRVWDREPTRDQREATPWKT